VARGRPQNLVVEPDPARAIKGAYQASSSDDVVLVSGSLFLVGAIKQALLEGRLKLGG
jgi:folylpolyglutamate synthase/dihydropteroate synthase